MKKHALPVISVVLAVAFAVFAVPAFAGGNGGGGQNDNAPAADHAPGSSGAPGSSADPPGQEKNGQQASPHAGGSSGEDTTAHGQTNKSDSPATAHERAKKTDSPAGVKPSNSTSHNVSAPAGSNATKLYGNGQTAGQIAVANGASADTPLYGPGNSQPHKTTPCGQAAHGNGGGYDVHALKATRSAPIARTPRPPRPQTERDGGPSDEERRSRNVSSCTESTCLRRSGDGRRHPSTPASAGGARGP
jgi:hypothetical protein